MMGKTLKELNVQPGDVVSFGNGPYTIIKIEGDEYFAKVNNGEIRGPLGNAEPWHLVSRASDTPKLWRDMTPEEKGALLLAHHEGKVIENKGHNSGWIAASPYWDESFAYRIRPEPKVETVTVYGSCNVPTVWGGYCFKDHTHRITFNLIDGKPDCDSVKMEEL